jgi:LDH2 family malate/lactate/ureidoglycolate dehydrogenase
MNISVNILESFAVRALAGAGMGEADARTTAAVLVTTDAWGVFTHGTKNLRGYVRRLRAGGIRAGGRPFVVREGPAWALADADAAIGMVGSVFAMRTAMRKARETGLGYVGLRNSCHFGAAGYYAALAAEEGMVGMAMANDTPTMTVPGGRTAALGSNPFAFAAPRPGGPPVLLDMATSAVAGGKVFSAAAHGRTIPEGWVVDADGRPTTDPRLFPHAASLLPMAGHKGYGVALWVEILSAVVPGAAIAAQVLSWSFADATRPTDHGAAFLAVDVRQMLEPGAMEARMGELVRQMHEAPRAAGVDRILLPGELEWERRERALREGIELPEDVVTPLRQLAAESGLEFPG